MEIFIKVFGREVSNMEEANMYGRMESIMRVCFGWIKGKDKE